MKRLHAILFILGAAFLVGLVWTIGPGELGGELKSLGWGLLPFVFGEGFAEMIHTVGWRRCLSGPLRSLPLPVLFRIRMSGYAINYLTPTASLGGEVIKATLLASKCPGPEAVSGLLVEKVAMATAHGLFVALGCVALQSRVDLPVALWTSMLLSGALVVSGIGTFLFLQSRGQLGGLVRWLAARKTAGSFLRKAADQITGVDKALSSFYREQPLDFCRAVLWHLLGFSVGIAQCWLFLRILEPGASLATAAAVCVFGMWFDLLTFAVPLNAGSQEGGRILVLKALGYSSLLGLTCGVALRLAQLFWAAVGLALYAWHVAATRRTKEYTPAIPGRAQKVPDTLLNPAQSFNVRDRSPKESVPKGPPNPIHHLLKGDQT
jgi:hypothetical protein